MRFWGRYWWTALLERVLIAPRYRHRGHPAGLRYAQLGQDERVKVQFLYFDGCPHWELAQARLREALEVHGEPVEVERVVVDTPEKAESYGFLGSPSVLIDGVDPFAEPAAPVALSCRLYRTPEGVAGSPTVQQLVAALSEASAS